MTATVAGTLVDWIVDDVAKAVRQAAQDLAEEVAADYDEPIADRDVLTEHLRAHLGRRLASRAARSLEDEVWDVAVRVLRVRGLPEAVAEDIVEGMDALEILPQRVVEVVEIVMRDVTAAYVGF